MTLAEAIDLLAPAIGPRGTAWMDLGAGSGTFTEALAHLLGPSGTIVAVDSSRSAVRALRALAGRLPGDAAHMVVARGSVEELSTIPELDRVEPHGALLANLLHFVRDPEGVLRAVASKLTSDGRIVLIEYTGVAANRWVPYPVSPDRFRRAARSAGFEPVRVVAEHPSLYRGTLYSAVAARRTPNRGE